MKSTIKYLSIILFFAMLSSVNAKTALFIRITKKNAFSPYTKIIYDITVRENYAIATHAKDIICFSEQFQKLGFLEKNSALKIIKNFEDIISIFEKENNNKKENRTIYEIWAVTENKKLRFEIEENEILKNEKFFSFLNEFKKIVLEKAGKIPFRNLFWEKSKIGYLTVLTEKSGKIISINDIKVDLSTPLYSYEISEGKHKIKISDKKGEKVKEFIVTIAPGMTTKISATIGD